MWPGHVYMIKMQYYIMRDIMFWCDMTDMTWPGACAAPSVGLTLALLGVMKCLESRGRDPVQAHILDGIVEYCIV